MRNLQILFWGASVLLFGGCSSSEDDINLPVSASSELDKVSFELPKISTEQDASDDTRAVIWDGTLLKSVWAENDSVGIFPEHGDQLSYSMQDGAGSTSAVFTGGSWALKTGESYSSYYPFKRWNYFKKPSELEIDYTGQVQDGLDNANHLTPYDYLVAPKTKAVNGKLAFSYQRIGFPMKLTLTVPTVGAYESLYLSASENLFVTKAELDLTTDTPTLTPLTKSSTHKVLLKNFTTTTANQQVQVFLMCFPIQGQGKTISVKLRSTSGHIYTATITPSVNYEANIRRNISKTMTYDTSESIGFDGEFSTEESDL